MNYNSFAAEHELLTFCMQMIEKGTGKKMEQKWERSLPGVGAAWLLMLTVAHGGVMAAVVLLLLTEGDRLFFSSFPLFFVLLLRFLFFLFVLPLYVFLSLMFPLPFPFFLSLTVFPYFLLLFFFSFVSLFLSVLLCSPLYNLPRLFFVPCSSLYLCIYKGERGKESYYPCLVMARG